MPAFVGLGAPHWDAGARGIICGLTRSSDRAHIVRATLESIAYQTRELIDAMQADAGERILELRVDGGAAANNFLMQFQADILDCPIVRPADIETTALGAAYLAGLATGFWKSVGEVESFWRAERRFEPAMDAEHSRPSVFRMEGCGGAVPGSARNIRWPIDRGTSIGASRSKAGEQIARAHLAVSIRAVWHDSAQTAQTVLFRAVMLPPAATPASPTF